VALVFRKSGNFMGREMLLLFSADAPKIHLTLFLARCTCDTLCVRVRTGRFGELS
jgi:hypothetical protein